MGRRIALARARLGASLPVLALVVVGCTSLDDDSRGDDSAVEFEASVQAAVDDFLARRSIPGASVAVIRHGRLVAVVSGHTDLEATDPVSINDEFRLASITKNYVAALALALADEGVVDLDEPIDRWLPPSVAHLHLTDVSLRQLLSHTSGLAQTATDDQDRGTALSLADVLARIPPPACRPGQCWSYADGNYVIAAVVLQAATGMPLTSALRTRFLDPLRLAHTHQLGEAGASAVPSYVLMVDPITGRTAIPHRLRRQQLPIITDGRAAQIIASASDLARWSHALFRGHAIDRSALAQMTDFDVASGLPCPLGCPIPYGLGVFRYEFAGHDFVGHDGSSGAIVASDPASGLTIAILTNGGEHDMRGFFEAVLAAAEPRELEG